MGERGASEARRRAATLLAAGQVGDETARTRGEVGEPVPVRGPHGELHSWFVPVTVGERLAGFAQLLPDLVLDRYSSFLRRPGELEGCPEAATWVDPERIRATARRVARDGEELGRPVLTFDRSPSRLAWAVPASSPDGGQRRILVAGEAAWVETAGGPGLY